MTRVVIRRIQEAETVRGGIIIPDTAKEKTPGRPSLSLQELASLKKGPGPFLWQ